MSVVSAKINDRNATIVFKNIDLSLVNSIRRIIKSDIPNHAFGEFNTEVNESPMSTDYIYNRIEMIPIVNGIDGAGCVLNVSGKSPENGIFTSNIKCENNKIKWQDDIKLFSLKASGIKKEKIKLNFKITSGIARDHAKYDCATLASCYEEKGNINLFYRSRGGIAPEKIFTKALSVFSDKLKFILSSIDNKESTKLIFSTNSDTNLTTITIKDEDDTIGNPVSIYLSSKYKDLYVAYNKPHPLEFSVKIIIKAPNAIDLFKEALEGIDKQINGLKLKK